MEGCPTNLAVPNLVCRTNDIPADHAVVCRVAEAGGERIQKVTILFHSMYKLLGLGALSVPLGVPLRTRRFCRRSVISSRGGREGAPAQIALTVPLTPVV